MSSADGAIVSILSVRGLPGQRFGGDDVEAVRDAAEPTAALVPMVERATWSVPRHALEAGLRWGRESATRRALPRRLAVVAILAGIAWLAFGTLPHRITVPARIVPERLVHLSVPWEGVLATAPPRPRLNAPEMIFLM